MSPPHDVPEVGDPVFHPKYGFGTVNGLTRRDRVHPIQEPSIADANSDRTEDYYDIQLVEGGTLLVPVSRAESAGLRRLTNGLEAVQVSLCTPAQSLPANARERAAVLRVREQLAEPDALAHAVRDMLAQGQGRSLSAGELAWLDKACQRLSMEIALVDHIRLRRRLPSRRSLPIPVLGGGLLRRPRMPAFSKLLICVSEICFFSCSVLC